MFDFSYIHQKTKYLSETHNLRLRFFLPCWSLAKNKKDAMKSLTDEKEQTEWNLRLSFIFTTFFFLLSNLISLLKAILPAIIYTRLTLRPVIFLLKRVIQRFNYHKKSSSSCEHGGKTKPNSNEPQSSTYRRRHQQSGSFWFMLSSHRKKNTRKKYIRKCLRKNAMAIHIFILIAEKS